MPKCRDCGADIEWMKTKNDKNIPVDAHSISFMDDDAFYDKQKHKCHFDTCSKRPPKEKSK